MTSLADPTTITRLRAEFDGRLIGPDDDAYDEARTVVMGGIDRRPAAVVRPADAEDVARIVSFARDSGLGLAVRSGGHSGAGHGVLDDGIVLDLREMRGLEIDAESRTAWVQTGLTAGEYTTAVGEHGLATGFGDAASVGIGGITLGGGTGFLSRLQGLTIDSLLAAEVVTADGRILEVDAENHPDLFWAIRGGGGNFGVATRFKFRLHEVPSVVGGMLLLPATPDVLSSFLAESDAAPDGLSTIGNVMPAPPMPFVPEERHGELVVMAQLCFAGPAEEGERVLEPFRSLAEPIVDMVRPITYPEMYGPEPEDYHPTVVFAQPLHRRGRPRSRGADARAPRPLRRRVDASRAVPRPRRRDRPRAGRGDGVRPPRRADDGQRRVVLRGPRRTDPPPRPGPTSSRPSFARAMRAPTSTSSATRARTVSARHTPARPGTGSRRSRRLTTRRTSSGRTRTSRRPRKPLRPPANPAAKAATRCRRRRGSFRRVARGIGAP